MPCASPPCVSQRYGAASTTRCAALVVRNCLIFHFSMIIVRSQNSERSVLGGIIAATRSTRSTNYIFFSPPQISKCEKKSRFPPTCFRKISSTFRSRFSNKKCRRRSQAAVGEIGQFASLPLQAFGGLEPRTAALVKHVKVPQNERKTKHRAHKKCSFCSSDISGAQKRKVQKSTLRSL